MFTLFKSEKTNTVDIDLHKAIETGAVKSEATRKTIEECIAKGANLAFNKINGLTPMQYAAKLKKWDLVLFMTTLKKTDSTDSYGYIDALELAASEQEENPVREDAAIALIRAGANLRKHVLCNGYVVNMLYLAINMQHIKIIKELINKRPSLLRYGYALFNPPLGFAADRADYCTRHKAPIEKQEKCWEIVGLLISFVKEDMKKKKVSETFVSMELKYGFDTALAIAAKYGKTECIFDLVKADAPLIPRKYSKKSVLCTAVENNHFTTTALLLHEKPSLEHKIYLNLLSKERVLLPALIDKDLINAAKRWRERFHDFKVCASLLLQGLAVKPLNSKDNLPTEPLYPKDILPQLILSLVIAMSEDLRLDWQETLPNEMSKDSDKSKKETLPAERFKINLNEEHVLASISNINWTHRVLAMNKNFKKDSYTSSPPKTITQAVKGLRHLRKSSDIIDCVAHSISNCVENEKPMLTAFFTKHELLTKEVAREIEKIELEKSLFSIDDSLGFGYNYPR